MAFALVLCTKYVLGTGTESLHFRFGKEGVNE